MKHLVAIFILIVVLSLWQYPPPGTPTPTPPTCEADLCPSGDTSGQLDTAALRAALATDRHIVLAHGDYYFTKIDNLSGLVPILYDGVTIDGGDWNHTVLYIVGEETLPGADWYLFHIQFKDRVAIRNVTIDGSLLNTVAEQTHGMMVQEASNLVIDHVRGQYIHGDTAKLAYSCDNCTFLDTEHLHNGRSGIAMRGRMPIQTTTNGGITIDGLLCINVSDQCVDMETGITPGEMILSNGRVYAPDNTGICMSVTGEADASGNPDLRVVMDNWQIYCRMYLFNAGNVTISNSLIDATEQGGVALLIQKASHNIIVSNSIIAGDGVGGVIRLTVHNSGRPSHILLSNLLVKASPVIVSQSTGIDIYDGQNVAVNNVTVQSTNGLRLTAGVRWRDVVAGIDRGYFSVNGLRVNNANFGVRIDSTAPEPMTVIDTLTIQNSHFRNVTTGIVLANPTTHSAPYVRAWNFDSNVYGDGVGTEIFIGSVFQ